MNDNQHNKSLHQTPISGVEGCNVRKEKRNKINAVLWDNDGVLVDSEIVFYNVTKKYFADLVGYENCFLK